MKQILFVDDDHVVIRHYQRWLQRAGYEVEVATDGLAATEVLKQRQPALVVLDLMLPKANGVEVLKYVRQELGLKDLPVVVLSNVYLSDVATRAMLAGATKVLLKNQASPSNLLRAIHELLPETATESASGTDGANGESGGKTGASALVDDEESERESLERARTAFLHHAAAEMLKIRELGAQYMKSAATPAGRVHLSKLFQRVHFISARAGLAGLNRVDILASAFEALLFELMAKPATVTPSVFRTIAQATDSLGRLLECTPEEGAVGINGTKVLVVDDDDVCNFFVTATLRRMGLEVAGTKDPKKALHLLNHERFDIALLDINMPDMDGFELCKRLRQIPRHQKIPVVFITGDGKFENRVQSVLSGGNEFITKPVIPLELALKTVAMILDFQLKQTNALPREIPAAPPSAVPMAIAIEDPEEITADADTAEAFVPSAELETASTAADHPATELAAIDEQLREALEVSGRTQQQLADLTEKRDNARADLEARQKSKTELEQVTEQLEHQVLEQSAELDRATEMLLAEQEALQAAADRAAELQALADRLRMELEDYAYRSADLERRAAVLRKKHQGGQPDDDPAAAMLRTQSDARQQLLAQMAETAKHRDEAEAKVRQAEARAKELADQRLKLEAELTRQTAAEAELRQQLNTAHAQLEAQAKIFSDDEAAWAAKARELEESQAKVAELQRAKQALEQQLEGQSAELARVASGLKTGQEALRESEATKARLISTAARREQELEAYSRQAEQWQRDQQAAEERLRAESAERERVATQLAETIRLRDAAAAQAQTAEAKAAELTQLRDSLEEQLSQRESAEAELRAELEAAQARLENQAATLSGEQNRVAELLRELEATRATVATL